MCHIVSPLRQLRVIERVDCCNNIQYVLRPYYCHIIHRVNHRRRVVNQASVPTATVIIYCLYASALPGDISDFVVLLFIRNTQCNTRHCRGQNKDYDRRNRHIYKLPTYLEPSSSRNRITMGWKICNLISDLKKKKNCVHGY